MNKKVVHINRKRNNPKSNQDVIEDLEELLDLARNGEIVAFAGVILTDRATMRNKYSGDISSNYLSFQGMLNDLSSELKNNYGE